MAMFTIKNVVLPAVLVSSAIFSILTLPFVLLKSEPTLTVELPLLSEPVTVRLPPLLRGGVQPILESENRDVAIRYVGGVIVVSVSAGIITIEVLRRLHASRRLVETQSPLPLFQSDLQQEEDIPADQPFSLAFLEENIDSFSSEANYALLLAKTDAKATHLELNAVHSQTLGQILESNRQYETCRIRVPHLERRLFAILWQGEYYSYLKTQKTKDKALEAVAKLNQSAEKSVITLTEQGYTIWVLQPEAFLDLVS